MKVKGVKKEEECPSEASRLQTDDEPSTSTGISTQRGLTAKTKGLESKPRKYDGQYIKYRFTCITINNEPRTQCVVCSEVLANDSLKPVKLIRHLQTKHPMLKGQKQTMTSQTTLPVKALTASYEVAHLVAKAKKLHTIAESLIRPAAMAICRTMFGDKYASDIEPIPLSDNTISRCITEMATDVKCQLIES